MEDEMVSTLALKEISQSKIIEDIPKIIIEGINFLYILFITFYVA
jgi:hypothetical protein